jgi:hypothetical protein
MFFVIFSVGSIKMFILTRTHVVSRETLLDNTTYNCPCAKTGSVDRYLHVELSSRCIIFPAYMFETNTIWGTQLSFQTFVDSPSKICIIRPNSRTWRPARLAFHVCMWCNPFSALWKICPFGHFCAERESGLVSYQPPNLLSQQHQIGTLRVPLVQLRTAPLQLCATVKRRCPNCAATVARSKTKRSMLQLTARGRSWQSGREAASPASRYSHATVTKLKWCEAVANAPLISLKPIPCWAASPILFLLPCICGHENLL